jgi:alkylated DNA repair protein (DNA oxidative demethylase)
MLPDGFHYEPNYLDEPGQLALAAEIRALLDEVPQSARTSTLHRIPQSLVDMWADATGELTIPNRCVITSFDADTQRGLHQDRDEASLAAPVLSISLGDSATFAVGGLSQTDPVERITLRSGDLVWFGGVGRLIFHGVEAIAVGTSTLLHDTGLGDGGRIELTLRLLDPM